MLRNQYKWSFLVATKIGDAKISNAYRAFDFEIRPKDIEEGQPNDPCSCAAALALKRATKAREVRVYRDVTYVQRNKDHVDRYHTSAALRLETIVFDREGNFVPGRYRLEPMPLREKSTRSTSSNGARRLTNRKKAVRHTIPNVRPTASQRLDRV